MKSMNAKILSLSILLSTNIVSQREEDWQGYKVSIPFIKILEIRPILVPDKYQAKIYPPKTSYKIDGYVYKLELTISISGNKEDFNQSIPIVIKTPANEEMTFTFNADRNPLLSNRLYEFVCELRLKYTGYTEVGFLRKFSDSATPVPVYETGLRLE